MRLMLSMFSESGDADGTSGVRNLKPRYLVVRFMSWYGVEFSRGEKFVECRGAALTSACACARKSPAQRAARSFSSILNRCSSLK